MSSQTSSHLVDPVGAVSAALGTDRRLWADAFDADPRYAEQVAAFTTTVTSCRALSDKDRDLILFGAAAAATAADGTMMQAHAARALLSGATVRELDEVLLAVAVLGGHAHSIAMTALIELDPEAGVDGELTASQVALKERWIAAWGFWNDHWDRLLRLDEEFFEAYLVFARGPWDNGILSHKFMELLYMGIDASCTHMYERGLAIHLRGARSRGASLTEIMDVLRLFGSQGLRSMSDGLAIAHGVAPGA